MPSSISNVARSRRVSALMRRWLRIGGVLLGVAVVVYGAGFLHSFVAGRRIVLALGAMSVPAEHIKRPAHLQPAVPGTFGELALPALDEFGLAIKEHPFPSGDEGAACTKVVDGALPIAQLPASCRDFLDTGRAAARHVLAATHSEEGGVPALVQVGDQADQTWWRAQLAARVAALDIREMLSNGERSMSVQECVDLVALSREVSFAGYLIGRMRGIAILKLADGPCRSALAEAPEEMRASARDQLRTLQSTMPTIVYAARTERVYAGFRGCGRFLLSGDRAKMPAAARVCLDEVVATSGGSKGPLDYLMAEPVIAGQLCAESSRWYDEFIELLERGDAASLAKDLARLGRRAWLTHKLGLVPDWSNYIKRDVDAQGLLAQLVAAAG